MLVGVRMKDGTFRKYQLEPELAWDYAGIITTVKREVIGSISAVVVVPYQPRMAFDPNPPEKEYA